MSFIAFALSLVVGYATEPVNFHAANAAEAADVAQQAAKVANRVAAHTEEVAHDTAAALRYTQDALKRAGANNADVRAVGREADNLEEEAGLTGEAGQSGRSQNSRQSREGYSRRDGSEGTSNRGEGYSRRDGSEGSSNGGSSRSSSNRGESQDASGRRISQEIRSGESGSASGRAMGYSDGRGGNSDGRGGGGHGNGGNRGSEGYQGYESGSQGGNIERSLDVNTEIVPYPNGVEPFGQEEPAKQMTKESVKQSDGMVKQIETAQGVEAKRSVYRALTKLRGATIASYDGMAKAHLKNVDNYNKKHKWREDHPMRHLAEEESDTHIWAFPKKAAAKKKAKKAPAANKAPAGVAAPAPAQAA